MHMRRRLIEAFRGTSNGGRAILGLAAASLLFLGLTGPVAGQGVFDPDPVFDHARNGDIGAVQYLLKKGAAVDAAGPAGETILSIAAGNGDLAMVDLALANGARADREDKYGKTPLSWAVERGHAPVVERLLKAGANINHQTQDGLTPVMVAVRANRLAVLQLLLSRHADLSLLDYTGRSALGWARDGRDSRAETMLRRAGAKD